MIKRTLLPLAALLAACGTTPADTNNDGIADGVKSPNNVSAVAPSTPTGTVSGVVANSKFAGISGATATFIIGGQGTQANGTFTATTDADGYFSIKNVPAGGNGQLLVTKDGFATARLNVAVPSGIGNIPLDNANANAGVVVLTELTGTVKFYVYGSNGRPAKGATAFLDVSPAAFVTTNTTTYGSPQGVITVEGTVDDTGVLTFTKVPEPSEMARVSGQYSLTIGAWDEDKNGQYESLGFARGYSGTAMYTNPYPVITLLDARQSANLDIVSANLDSLTSSSSAPYRNAIHGSDPITVVFNQPIAAGNLLSVKVVTEDCASSVNVKLEQKAPNLLTISPMAPWATGVEYHLAIHVTGTDTSTTRAFTGFFWAIDPTAPRPISMSASFVGKKVAPNNNNNQLQSGDELYVIFDTPIHYFGGGGAQAYIDYDINSSGSTGSTGDIGEYGSTTGFSMALAEQTFDATSGTMTCAMNTYGTRWRIAVSGISNPVPSQRNLKVSFPRDSVSVSGYETVWGQPFVGEISGPLTITP